MSLINCTECGRQISDKAKSCPGCGAPIAITKFCKHCGAKIELDCIVCPICGKQVEALRDKNIVINNSSSAQTMATMPQRRLKHYNGFVDFILIVCTCGLWIIWMIVRPKYEY